MGEDSRRAVSELLLARLPEVTADVVAEVQRAVPAYRRLTDDQLSDMTAITTWALVRLLEAWRSDGGLDDGDRARFRAIGAARAEDGRPLPAVLRSYRVAAALAVVRVMELGSGSLDTADLRVLTRVVLALTDELTEAVTAGYGSARDRLSGDRGRALRDLLDDLLVGRQSSAGAVADRSRELGLDLPEHVLLLVVEPADAARVLAPPALDALRADLGRPTGDADPLATLHGRRAVLLLPDTGLDAVEPVVRARGLRGCAVRRQPLLDVAAGHRLAAAALDTAPAHAFASRAVLTDGDAHLLALLAGRPGARPEDVVRTVLGPLADADHAHLLQGLGAYLSAGSATDAAALLHVHPQTLRYRLRRVAAVTGRDPRDPWHRLVLDVAHHLVQMAGTPGWA